MNEELDDMHINLAVRLLMTQFPDLSCLIVATDVTHSSTRKERQDAKNHTSRAEQCFNAVIGIDYQQQVP